MELTPSMISNWSWIDFCGRETFVVWNSKHQDLDICFQYIAFQMPILTLLTIVSAYYVGALRLHVRRCKRDMWLLRIRTFFSLTLFVVPTIRAYVEETMHPGQLNSVDYTLAAIQSFSWLVHFCYLANLQNKQGATLRGPVPIGVLWSINYIVSWMNLHTNYLIVKDPDSVLYGSKLPFIFAAIETGLQSLYLLTLLPTGRNNPRVRFHPLGQTTHSEDQSPPFGAYSRFREEDDRGYLGNPMDGYGRLGQLCFSWVNPLLDKGTSGKLESADDLFDLPVGLSSQYLSSKISRAVYPLHDSYIRTSLIRALHSCFWAEFYGVGVLKFLGDVTGFCGPLLLKMLVQFVEDRTEPVTYGYAYACALCATSLIGAFCNAHFNFKMSLVGLRIRGALVSLIYRKTLSLNKVTISSVNAGEIINYMSVDVNTIMNSCHSFHSFWSIPFQVVVISYLLYLQVGMSFLAVVAITLLLMPVNRYVASYIGKFSRSLMEHKDSRISCMTEILKGMKTIKLNVWEAFFMKKIGGFRRLEMKYLAAKKYMDAICVYLWATTPIISTTSTFVLYIYMGHQLTASTVFTTIALLNMLIFPLNAFPWVLNGVVEAWVSVKRVEKLLKLADEDLHNYYDPSLQEESPIVVNVQNANFHWRELSFKLQSIDFSIQEGQLVGIIGPVGCGKTSILAALLAELSRSSGSVLVRDYESGFGYSAQVPWLQKGTIMENILFGDPYNHQKYWAVLAACALVEDVNSLPGRDNYNIGEGGSALSGGQKARISLARAVYKNVPLYLLDDMLSSVDARVAKHILTHCICGLLKNKTRILITHHPQYLVNADLVIEVKDGRIVKKGPPSEVLPNYIDYVADMQLSKGSEPEEMKKDREVVEPPATSSDSEEERRTYGFLDWKVYSTYFIASGLCLWPFVILSIFTMQGGKNLTDWWLAHWVSNIQNGSIGPDKLMEIFSPDSFNSNVTDHTSFYLVIYVGIGGISSVVALSRAFLFAYAGLVAAKTIHNNLLHKVVNAKITFFDVTSVGHVLNRFSSDVCTVDDSLPFVLNILVAVFFGVVGSLVMTIYSLPYVCLIIAPLVPIYHNLQSTYRSTSCELKRLSSLTLTPLYSHFAETVQGLMTIRAFRVASKFKLDNATWLDSNTKTQLSSSAAAQWLTLRLQLIGVAMISGVGLLAVLRHHLDIIDPGFVGLAISYTLGLTTLLGSLVSVVTETEMEMVSVERINHYLNEQHEGLESEDRSGTQSPPFSWPTHGVVCFSKVYFRHRDYLPYCLKNISFTTRPGERIGIVGRTGAGKSSIVAALFRLAEVAEGTISIDDVNIRDIALYDLR